MTSRSTRPRELRPDFFIVGAPKCGTTSLDGWLAEHPAIFMAAKEQHFFGSDLDGAWPPPTEEAYFASFAGSESATRRGEASVWYLWSREAAREIHDYDPDARIVVAIRNPVEMLPSLHSQYLYGGIEDIQDFALALAAEDDRREGRRIPPRNGTEPWRLFYREIVRFDQQLERYLDVFGPDQIHVVLFDDLVVDPTGTYRRLLEFLEVDPGFVPELPVLNPNKRVRSPWLKTKVRAITHPSSRVRRAGTRLIPAHAVRSALLRAAVLGSELINTSVEPRPPLDPAVRMRLAAEFAPDIDRLGRLLQRDLGHWYRPVGGLATDTTTARLGSARTGV